MWIRKRLEPLEAYVPAIILTEMQIQELGNTGSLTFIFANIEYVTCNGTRIEYGNHNKLYLRLRMNVH